MVGSGFVDFVETNEEKGVSLYTIPLCCDGIGGDNGVGESRWGEERLLTRHEERGDFKISLFYV